MTLFGHFHLYLVHPTDTPWTTEKTILNAYQETFQCGFGTCFGTCWATVAHKFILQISNDVSLFLPFNIAGVLKSRSAIWINSFPPLFFIFTIPFTEEKITKLFDWCKHQPPDLKDRTDRGMNISSAFQRYTPVNAASEVIEVAGSNHAIRVFLNLARGPNNLSPTTIWSWRIRSDSQPFRLVSCQQTLSFRTFVSASANNKRVVRGPQNYFMSAKVL